MARTITGKVTRAKQIGNSVNGTPTYMVAVEDVNGDTELYRTMSDAGLAYDIRNLESSGEVCTLALTKAGRLRNLVL